MKVFHNYDIWPSIHPVSAALLPESEGPETRWITRVFEGNIAAAAA